MKNNFRADKRKNKVREKQQVGRDETFIEKVVERCNQLRTEHFTDSSYEFPRRPDALTKDQEIQALVCPRGVDVASKALDLLVSDPEYE